MTVLVPDLDRQGIGGGNTFIENFVKWTGLTLTTEFGDNPEALFIANPMRCERDMVAEAKRRGMRIVLRLDNIPEDWNNRGTAISKLRDHILAADHLIFQSRWAQEKYMEFIRYTPNIQARLNAKGESLFRTDIIPNGVDTTLFTPEGENRSSGGHPRILFVKSSRNENKRYPEAMELFRRYWAFHRDAKLLLVGAWAREMHEYNFGFYNGEQFEYLGEVEHQRMAEVYRSADVLFFPAFADCAPNVVLEAMACGVVPIVHPYGGAIETVLSNENHDKPVGVVLDYSMTYAGMVEAALSCDREEVVAHIRTKYSITEMVMRYDEVLRGQ